MRLKIKHIDKIYIDINILAYRFSIDIESIKFIED
jgi:hypothetical protein